MPFRSLSKAISTQYCCALLSQRKRSSFCRAAFAASALWCPLWPQRRPRLSLKLPTSRHSTSRRDHRAQTGSIPWHNPRSQAFSRCHLFDGHRRLRVPRSPCCYCRRRKINCTHKLTTSNAGTKHLDARRTVDLRIYRSGPRAPIFYDVFPIQSSSNDDAP